MTKTTTTSKRAGKKISAASKTSSKKTSKRSGRAKKAKPATPVRTRTRRDSETAAAEKATRNAFRSQFSEYPREQWVSLIKSPAQRILADVSARVCALFGIPPDALRGDRRDQSPRSRNENSLRGIALGAVIDVGVAMGLSWNELHTHHDFGRSDVLDLPPHAHTIRIAHARWLAVQETEGIVLDVARARVEEIKAMACTRMASENKG